MQMKRMLACSFSYNAKLLILDEPTSGLAPVSRDELSADLKAKSFGIRTFSTGFEALMKTETIPVFSNLNIEPATIDDIVVFTSKKGENHEITYRKLPNWIFHL